MAGPVMIAVGSTAVRAAIFDHQPTRSVNGVLDPDAEKGKVTKYLLVTGDLRRYELGPQRANVIPFGPP
jgi:hypothetical protein